MNRMLFVPAICCLSAFALLLLVLHGAVGREPLARSTRLSEDKVRASRAEAYSSVAVEPAGTPSAGSVPMNDSESEQLLRKLSDEYVRPWREWQNSPHRLYSRAAPRPVPSISAEVVMSQQSAAGGKHVALATIAVRTGLTIEQVPCILDRSTGSVHLFADGQWLTSDEWLKRAPTPRGKSIERG